MFSYKRSFGRFFLLIVAVLLFIALKPLMARQVDNGYEIRDKFGLQPFIERSNLSNITIAVFDNDFGSFLPDKGFLTPGTPEVIKGPYENSSIKPSSHGLQMAQIVWETTGKKENGPKFLLFQTNGITNLRSAIERIVRSEFGPIDIVLNSANFTTGGNFDGRGFINAEFDKLTQENIIVINAAGAYNNLVYNGPVIVGKKQFLNLKKEAPYISEITSIDSSCPKDSLCFYNSLDENSVSITLSWNDFKDYEDYQTKKDLDLYLFKKGNNDPIASSISLQKGQTPEIDPESGGYYEIKNKSAHPREQIKAFLERGWYRIKIRAKSIKEKDFLQAEIENFSHAELKLHEFSTDDRFRVTIQGEKPASIYFQDRTSGYEIMIPSDNPKIITVGDTTPYSSKGPTMALNSFDKPDILLEAIEIYFSTGMVGEGTSSSAAVFAGMTALLKGINLTWSTEKILQYAKKINMQGSFSDTPICISRIHPSLRNILPSNTKYVVREEVLQTIYGPRMFNLYTALIPFQPEELMYFRNLHANSKNSFFFLVFQNNSIIIPTIAPRDKFSNVPMNSFRVVQEDSTNNSDTSPKTWKMPQGSF